MFEMFFSLPNDPAYPCAGLFTGWHFLLLACTLALIALGLYLSRSMQERAVRRTVRIVTAVLWALELLKILFVLLRTGSRNPNDFVPLYYCSLILYAGLLSSLGRGRLRYMGDCFIGTASLVGGIVFLVMPTTSLPRYPAFHFISWHSFLLHGLMVYLGLLLLAKGIYRPRPKDVHYCAILISIICALAFAFNVIYDHISGETVANLMFISKDFPGTPITLIYHLCGPVFPVVMWLGQAYLPFLLVLGGYSLLVHLKKRVRQMK